MKLSVCEQHFHKKNRLSHKITIPLHEIISNCSSMVDLNRIKVVLVEKGTTGKWLAEKIGTTPCTVNKWYSNSSQSDFCTLEKTANLLGVDK